jgi:hypothetical protein
MQNIAAISELLKPCDPQFMRSYPVSTRMNHVANDDEECSSEIQAAGFRSGIAGHKTYLSMLVLDLEHLHPHAMRNFWG